LATNGLWISEATGILSIGTEQRADLVSRLLGLIAGASR